jgi:hypothetical protein
VSSTVSRLLGSTPRGARHGGGSAGTVTRVILADAAPGKERAARTGGGRHAATVASRLPVSVVMLIAATGVLIVAAAYTAGRLGHASSPWANRAYWFGQALILGPTACRLLSKRVLAYAETVTLITVLTVAEFLAMVCYSPASFTYADELEHWRGTVNILQTGKLFTPNYLLPISPHYPGLEEITSALVSITGLSVFTSGLIVAGVAHLLFVCVLYMLFQGMSGSYRIAGVAVLLYASNPLFASFDSMFIYQTLALPFLGLTLLALLRLSSRGTAGQRAGWLILAVVAIVATVVTHHITSYVLMATLILVTLAALLTRNRQAAAWAAVLSLLSAGATVSWLMFAAPQTWGYLQPVVNGMTQSIRTLLAGGHTIAPPTSTGPLSNRLLAAVAVLTVSALVPLGWWQVWRRYRRHPWTVAMAVGSVTWYVVVAVRFTAADGSELAGRAATFVFIPTTYIIAVAIGHLASTAIRWRARAVAAAVLVVVLLLLFDGLANGWPPYWERLPGPYLVAGFERSVEPDEIAAANWALEHLGPGNRFAADSGSYPVLGSYGDEDPVRDVAYLYTSPVFTQSDASLAIIQSLRYVFVDQRLSQSLPASGQYFPVDPNAGKYTEPLSSADLDKFNSAAGVDRIYDSGNIVIYQLTGT